MIVIGLALAISAVIAYTLMTVPHEFGDDECPKCHMDVKNNPKALTGTITELCRECHKKQSKKSSHPVDIAPVSVSVPRDLPLTNGLLTCNTCHNIHEVRFNAFGEKTFFMRRPAIGRDLCLACHKASKGPSNHIEIISVAHLRTKYSVTDKASPLDPMSIDCIGCHDGNVGKDIIAGIGAGAWKHNNGSHPVGVSYRQCRMRKGKLTAPEKLDKRIRFFNGKIGCGTCHDLYSSNRMQLVISNDGSRLCFACHEV